jgi:class 3 adenylate cyclase
VLRFDCAGRESDGPVAHDRKLGARMAELPSGTVTFLFTDIEASTRLLKRLRDQYGEVLAAHRRILRAAFEAHGGQEIDTQGDSFFVAFRKATDAALAASQAQRALAEHSWPDGARCRVRMGMHTGEPTVGDEGYHGLGVSRAARIMAAGHGGQVLLSQATCSVLEDDELSGIRVRDLGRHRLKDLDQPERLYQLEIQGLAHQFPPLRTAKAPSARPAAGAPEKAARASAGVIGRASLLVQLADLAAFAGPEAIVLTGSPGMGKTTLWEAGIRAAEGARRVLAARPGEAEAWLSFATVIDLLAGVGSDELAAILPPPQLRALEAALLRAESEPDGTQQHVTHVAFLTTLRALAAQQPLLVAVDDLQWLDSTSAALLSFAARRTEGQAVRFLLARRPGDVTPLELALERTGLRRLEVAGLGMGSIRRLLEERLGLRMGRRQLRQIVQATEGNPLFALELGRSLAEHGLPAPGEPLPVPDRVEDLLGTRVGRLAVPVRRLLLAFALHGELHADELEGLAGRALVDDAVESGLVVVDGDRLRPSHPLLPAAARKRSRARERRALHLVLAGLTADEERRALHMALAATAPDEDLARSVFAAAAAAKARGATPEAVVLSEHAFRLTPPDSPARVERLLPFGSNLEQAGERRRLADLVVPELDSLPRGPVYGRACLLLAEVATSDAAAARQYVRRALEESGDDASLRAEALAELAVNQAVTLVERIPEAATMAEEALEVAPPSDAMVYRHALYVVTWTRSLAGKPIEGVLARFRQASDTAFYVMANPGRVAGQRHVWRGEIAQARRVITELMGVADEQEEPVSYALMRLHLCELELRVGDWRAAGALLDEWAQDREGELLKYPMEERCRALLAAGRGLAADAEAAGAAALTRAQEVGVCWDRLEASRALGQAALVRGDPALAVERLRPVWEHIEREGVAEPGAFPVAPELVEGLVEQEAGDEAARVTRRLGQLAEAQDHSWGRITAVRCAAMVRLASAEYDERTAEAILGAAQQYAAAGLRFDHARSLLVLGRWQRRLRKWAAARRTLGAALAAFAALDSPAWGEKAESELVRVQSRRSEATPRVST